ncbi:7547_t:CDS:2 [Scutellospora calospora]|uniref:7547_t:CDS:1 n=1 Tax=Scutellospora calospora TaxID=85575 RepID=A0ACA9KW03_9GLOM|nr:7547_t:CDS:2 [Scutellospora calospora]
MSEKNRTELRYSDYWARDSLTWSVNDWDVYFIRKHPYFATPHKSHLALSEEIRSIKRIYADIEHPANKASQRLLNELKENEKNKKIWERCDKYVSLDIESQLVDIELSLDKKKGIRDGLNIARKGFKIYSEMDFESVERERKRLKAHAGNVLADSTVLHRPSPNFIISGDNDKEKISLDDNIPENCVLVE